MVKISKKVERKVPNKQKQRTRFGYAAVVQTRRPGKETKTGPHL